MTAPRAGAPPGNVAGPDPGTGADLDVDKERDQPDLFPVADSVAELEDRDGYRRIALARRASARCLMCFESWSTPTSATALAAAVQHVKSTGHAVTGSYASELVYVANAGGGP
jgi:hypothetical protein